MSDSRFIHRRTRRLRVGALSAVAIISVAAAAVPGLPFTEDFLNTNLRGAATTADWGITTPGILQLGTQVSLENLGLSGSLMGDGNDGPHRTRGIATGDFDSDGDLDAAVPNENDEVNLVYFNDAGAFTAAPVNLGTDAVRSRSIAVGDLDLDGDLDIVVGNYQSRNVYHLNDGDGVFTDAIEVTNESGRTWPIALYDLDGDNDLDLIEGQADSRVNRVFLNTTSQDGNLSFLPADDISTDVFTTNALALGDVNSDGFVDLVTGDHNSVNHLYYGDGNGGFSASTEIQPGQAWNTFALALADVNSDGNLDLIEGVQRDGSDQNGETKIYLNNGAGGFLAPTLVAGSNTLHTTVAFVTLDYDSDGDIDIVEGNNGGWDHDNDAGTAEISQPNRLYLNDGTGQFPTAIEITPGSTEQTYGMAAGDFDGDGIVDFLAGNQTGENMVYSVAGTPTANSFRQLSSVAESIRIDDGSQGNTRFARIRIDPLNISQPVSSELNFFLSNDDGANYVPATLDRPVEFPNSTALPIRWKVEMSTNSPNISQLPTVTELTISDGDIFPRFVGPSVINGALGNAINPVQLNFVDDDGDRLSYVLTGLPAGSGLKLDQEAGIIFGTVTNADAAAAPFTINTRAFDGVRFSPAVQGNIDFVLGGPNTVPVANNDGPFVINEGGSVAGNPNVLSNDTDANGDAFTALLVSPPLNDDGNFVLNADGTFSYTHDGSATTSDSFTYTANDQGGPSNVATVSINITLINDAPEVVTPIGNQSVTEGIAGSVSVAASFSDPDGDMLTFSQTGLPSPLTLSTGGTISGTAGAADVGTYDVTITATDPSGESVSDNFVLTVVAAAPTPPPPTPRSSGGCTVGPADGTVDPTLPLLMLLSLVYLQRRRLSETSICVR